MHLGSPGTATSGNQRQHQQRGNPDRGTGRGGSEPEKSKRRALLRSPLNSHYSNLNELNCHFTGCISPVRTMPEGGPCAHCDSDSSTVWYGGRNNPQYCRKNACLRAGGYRPPLSDANSEPSSRTTRKRRRRREVPQEAAQQPRDSDEEIESEWKGPVSEIFMCLGMRYDAWPASLRAAARRCLC